MLTRVRMIYKYYFYIFIWQPWMYFIGVRVRLRYNSCQHHLNHINSECICKSDNNNNRGNIIIKIIAIIIYYVNGCYIEHTFLTLITYSLGLLSYVLTSVWNSIFLIRLDKLRELRQTLLLYTRIDIICLLFLFIVE